MSDEFQLRQDQERGVRAAQLLESDLLKEAFAALEAQYIEAWRETGARDTDARERLWQALQIVGKVRGHLQAVASNGQLAARELAEIATMGERRKVLGVF